MLATFSDYTTALFYDDVFIVFIWLIYLICLLVMTNRCIWLYDFLRILYCSATLSDLQEKTFKSSVWSNSIQFYQTVLADSSQFPDLTECWQDVPRPLRRNRDSNTPSSMNASNSNIEDHLWNHSYFQQTSDAYYNLLELITNDAWFQHIFIYGFIQL